jgi:hypothetical protein
MGNEMKNENRNQRNGRDGDYRFGGDGGNHQISSDRAGSVLHVNDSNRIGLAKGTAIAAGLILYVIAARIFRLDPFKD